MTKKIDFLNRLFKLEHCYDDLIDSLLQEKIISQEQKNTLNLEVNRSQFLYIIIKEAQKEEKILLANFDWEILPIERLKITLVTERTTIEFSHNY